MPHYPSNFNNISTGNTYNNDITRRLAVKRLVGWGQSPRFGGQWLEPKGVPVPYEGTIMDAVAATQQLLDELNQISPLMPDLGVPAIISAVGVATNLLTGFGNGNNGVAVTYLNAVGGTNAAFTATIDGVGLTTGLRVLYYGLSTASFNGVWAVSTAGSYGPGYSLYRAPDMAYYWQFVKPKVYVVQQGTVNKGQTFALATDNWQVGPTFSLALGTGFVAQNTAGGPQTGITQTAGTPITFVQTNYSPGIGTTTASLIYPPYGGLNFMGTTYTNFAGDPAPGYLGGGEYNFLAANSLQEFMYLKNRMHRLAYRVFKMRENYQPQISIYQNDVPFAIGLGNTQYNIGVNTSDNLPPTSRYPSSQNRGW